MAKVLRIRSSCTWVRTRGPSDWFRPFYTVNAAVGMGLLFFLAGYFVPRSYDRKGLGRFLKEDGRIGLPLLIFALAVHLPVGLRRRPPSPASRVALMGRNRFDELERRRSGRPSRRHCLVKLPALVERVTSNRQAEPPKRLTPSGGRSQVISMPGM